MIILCRSVKGGSGTTVTAASLALLLAPRHRGGGYLVDLNGDQPAALGIPEPEGSTMREVNSALRLLPRPMNGAATDTQWLSLATELASLNGPVVVDVGTLRPGKALVDATDTSYLVTRPCYLALRRATTLLGSRKDEFQGCVLIEEPGRALTANDVATVLRLPVVARIGFDSAVSRSVDAGLLAQRVPKCVDDSLAELIAIHAPR
jgi:hypothetical protein